MTIIRILCFFSSSILLAIILNPTILASPGDYSPGYQRCVNSCNFRHCYTVDPKQFFQWTCTDDCAYRCMHDLTQKVLKLPRAVPNPGETFEGWWDEPDWTPGTELEGLPPGRIVQFHGKWPFKRVFGIQEPLSAAFSLLNLLAYMFSYRLMKKKIPLQSPLRNLYLGVALVGVNAWIWSIIFHCRDKPWTERLDYFSAAAYSLYGLYVSSVRIFRLYPSKAKHRVPLEKRLYIGAQLKLILSALFLVHIAFLSYGERFNYKYNMAVNVLVGISTIALWIAWTASYDYQRPIQEVEGKDKSEDKICESDDDENRSGSPDGLVDAGSSSSTTKRGFFTEIFQSMATTTSTGVKPPYTKTPIVPLICVVGAGSLELLDFPPILNMSLDAHALWHLATWPLGPIWCIKVLTRDARWESKFVEGIQVDDAEDDEH
ncbi:Per1-like protein [Phakopsora pachyrhizi]|nr:Per1-like protein [Phakopsora pachyrhizi]